MSHRYSTALSHIILAGTSIYCLKVYGTGDWKKFPVGTYGIIITNSLLGIWYWGNSAKGHKVEKPYKLSAFLQKTFALPLIVAYLYLLNSYKKEYAYAHAAVSILPLIQYLVNKVRHNFIDIIIGLNCLSLGYIAYITENYFGIAAAVSYALNHFFLAKEQDVLDIPLDVYNYGNKDNGNKVEKPYKVTLFLQTIFALPLVVAEAWLMNGYQKEYAFAHAAIPILPLAQYLAEKDYDSTIDVIITLSCMSLGYVSFVAENYWGIGCAVAFAITQLCNRDQDYVDLPREDVYNYCLTISAYCALRALGGQ